MAIRTLKRKVIIREYDYERVKKEAFMPLATMGVLDTLYDRASFTPLSQENLEKIKLFELLKGKRSAFTDKDLNLKMPAVLLADLRDYLYDSKYYKWKVTVDDEGYLCVQARKNTPKSRIGLAVFEKDLESRL